MDRHLLENHDGLDHHDRVISYFNYYPQESLGIVALALFAAITLAIFMIMVLKRRQWFMSIVVFTGLCEVAGYVCRIVSISNPVYGSYVAMQCFLIISPTFLALANYVMVGKLMRIAGAAKLGFLKPSWVYRFFFASDLFCLAIQGAGAGLSVSPDDNSKPSPAGKPLLLVGLGGQLFFFACFAGLAVYMHVSRKYGLKHRRDLDASFVCLYVTTALLFIRNTYRVIEFAQGWRGYLARHEVFFYIFDALLVFAAFVTYCGLHSSIFLPSAPSASIHPSDRKDATAAPSRKVQLAEV